MGQQPWIPSWVTYFLVPCQLTKPLQPLLTLHISTHCHSDECDLTQFWQLESAGTAPVNNTNDKGYLTEYAQTSISRQPDGSYCAKLPWKATHLPLPTNREICKKRAHSLVNRLSQSPQLLQAYNNIIREQVTWGFIEKVQNTSDCPGKTHYMPHHCVKDSTTTPIQIVYNCSCRQSVNHPSLNDCLLTGPRFLNDLCSILLHFRSHKYAISADIEKVFLQITLHEDDRNFTRFYWLSDPSDQQASLMFTGSRQYFLKQWVLLLFCMPPYTTIYTNTTAVCHATYYTICMLIILFIRSWHHTVLPQY